MRTTIPRLAKTTKALSRTGSMLVVLVLSVSAPAFSLPGLEVARDPAGVSVQGATPGGRVWLCGTSRSFVDYREMFSQEFEFLTDSDGDGLVTKETAVDASRLEEWLVVDEARGELAASRGLSPAPGGLVVDFARGTDAIELQGRWFEIFLIARAEGVWRSTVMDGGPSDHDGGIPGSMIASFADWQDVSGADKAGPLQLRASDVLVVLDPLTQAVSRVVAP